MERGDSHHQKQQKTTSALKLLQATYSINSRSNGTAAAAASTTNNNNNNNNDDNNTTNTVSVANQGNNNNNNGNSSNAASRESPQAWSVREQDQYMPIANVIRIMRRILPPHAKISDDAKETIQECVSEYISFITGEANDRCQREQRKTITAEDILWAMGKLGFDDYTEPLTIYLNRYREVECDRTALRGEPPFLKRSTAEFGTMGSPGNIYGAPYYHHHHHHHHHHSLMGFQHQLGTLDAGAMGGYHRHGAASRGSSSSSSHAATPNFDPYAQYK